MCYSWKCVFIKGSIMAVTVADKYAPGKSSRFVGICIHRSEHGLRHQFILRNVIDDQGIILYLSLSDRLSYNEKFNN